MGLRAMWFSAVVGVIGAIIWRIFTQQLTGVNLRIVAGALMLAGAAGMVASSVAFVASRLRRFVTAAYPIVPSVRKHRESGRSRAPGAFEVSRGQVTAFAKEVGPL